MNCGLSLFPDSTSTAAKRGVKITILTAGKSDVTIVKLAARYIYNVFLKNGVHYF